MDTTLLIDLMKDTIIEMFGFECNETIQFFKDCEVMSFDNLCNHFYLLTGVET